MKIKLLIAIAALVLAGCSINQPNVTNNNVNTGDTTAKPETNSANNNIDIPASNILDLSSQELSKIPDNVFNKTNLEELNVSNNKLSGAMQAEIRQLSKLKILNASNNMMTGVPAEVGQLSNLEVLDLSNNQLTGLPYEIGNLQKLKTLNISGNNYSAQDLKIIQDKLPATVNIIK